MQDWEAVWQTRKSSIDVIHLPFGPWDRDIGQTSLNLWGTSPLNVFCICTVVKLGGEGEIIWFERGLLYRLIQVRVVVCLDWDPGDFDWRRTDKAGVPGTNLGVRDQALSTVNEAEDRNF